MQACPSSCLFPLSTFTVPGAPRQHGQPEKRPGGLFGSHMDTLQFGWLSQGSFGRQQRVRGFERETGIPGVGQMGTAVGRRRGPEGRCDFQRELFSRGKPGREIQLGGRSPRGETVSGVTDSSNKYKSNDTGKEVFHLEEAGCKAEDYLIIRPTMTNPSCTFGFHV